MMDCKSSNCLFNIDGECTRQSKKDITAIEKWKNDFKSFISRLSLPEDDYYGIMQYIDEVPNETKWIYVSEGLPEYGEVVLTVNSDDDYEINHIIDDDSNEWFYDDGVVAWMSLPPCYYLQVDGIMPTVINNDSDIVSAKEIIDDLLHAIADGGK